MIFQLEDTVTKQVLRNEQLMGEYSQLREENQKILESFKIEEQKSMFTMQQNVNQVREKMLIEQAELMSRADVEKREQQSKHDKEMKQI